MEDHREAHDPPPASPERLMGHYVRGDHHALTSDLLGLLHNYRRHPYEQLDDAQQRELDASVQTFLTLFTQRDYRLLRDAAREFVRLGAVISNVVALSSFRSTDPFLPFVAGPDDLPKRLALWSARNAQTPDRRAILDADPDLGCLWYGVYAETYRTGLLDPVVWGNLRDHFAFEDDRLSADSIALLAYFASTYVGGDRDRTVRSMINRSFQALSSTLTIRNAPNPRKIAVLSNGWTPGHSAYRITRAFVEALRGYHLTLVPLGNRPGMDRSLFDEVRPLAVDAGGVVDIGPLRDNDFMVAFYPEVGLSPQSMLLTNLRIAPIQIAALGHSVSTFGALVDYYVSGTLVEPPDDPPRNYSERLILLPRLGAVHERPDYAPRGAGRRRPDGRFVLNAPWNAQKLGHPFSLLVKEVFERSSRPLLLRIFAGGSLKRQNDYLPFRRAVEDLLGRSNVEVLQELSYVEYMAAMEEGDLSLDAFPFGGCNTVVDSLYVRRLIVCREGESWYNRIGPAMLRLLGLPELVAATDEAFFATTLRLIHDDEFRDDLQIRLDAADVEGVLFDRSEAASFRRVVDELVANHERWKADPERTPIRAS